MLKNNRSGFFVTSQCPLKAAPRILAPATSFAGKSLLLRVVLTSSLMATTILATQPQEPSALANGSDASSPETSDAAVAGGNDIDNDGILDTSDNCPGIPNGPSLGTCVGGTHLEPCLSNANCFGGVCIRTQADSDGDGRGDACDNCRFIDNGPSQGTCRAGSVGNIGMPCITNTQCGACVPLGTICCSKNQEDIDQDGFGDVCDNCPTPNGPMQGTCYGSGQSSGDLCYPWVGCQDSDDDCFQQQDHDNDGRGTVCDNCPTVDNGPTMGTCLEGPNRGAPCTSNAACNNFECSRSQQNTDGDALGDACDNDDDNDGVADTSDIARIDPHRCQDMDFDTCDDCWVGTDGFGPLPDDDPEVDGPDFDHDGLCDDGDNCENDHNRIGRQAEVFQSRDDFADVPGVRGLNWAVVPSENDSNTPFRDSINESYLQCLYRRSGVSSDVDITDPRSDAEACFVSFAVHIPESGSYRLYVSAAGLRVGTDNRDTLHAFIEELSDGTAGDHADWYTFYLSTNATFPSQPVASARREGGAVVENAEWFFDVPGWYTLMFVPGENGVAIDYFVFQAADAPAPDPRIPDQTDSDGDGVGDDCDNCVQVFNPNQENSDGTGLGDHCSGEYAIGELVPIPVGASVQATWDRRQTQGSISPLMGILHHPRVYSNTPRLFFNQRGLVTIQWYTSNGNPVGNPRAYSVRDEAVASAPEGAPYAVGKGRLFQEYFAAQPVFGVNFSRAISYNDRINASNIVLADDGKLTVGPSGLVPETFLITYSDLQSGPLKGLDVVTVVTSSPNPTPIVGASGTIGRAIPKPPVASTGHVYIAQNGPSSTITDDIAWPPSTANRFEGELYAIQPSNVPENLGVVWYQESSFGTGKVYWPLEVWRYKTVWPADPQLMVIHPGDPPTEAVVILPVDADGSETYCDVEIMYQGATQPASTPGKSTFHAIDPGYYVLRFDKRSTIFGQECSADVGVAFEVVRARAWNETSFPSVHLGAFTVPVGKQINPPPNVHNGNAPFEFGYVKEGLTYAANIYDGSSDAFTGQIIPVNDSTVTKPLEIWWFKEGTYAPGIYWPHKSGLYHSRFNESYPEIVVASRLGYPLPQDQWTIPADAEIYEVGNYKDATEWKTVAGWNPNDEHAEFINVGGERRVFAVRDDDPWLDTLAGDFPLGQSTPGHAHVLLQYWNNLTSLWEFKVIKVVGERPELQFDFDYTDSPSQLDPTEFLPIVAGQTIDPLFPVNQTGRCPETYHTGDPLWKDRNNVIWAVRPPANSSTPGVVWLWENWGPDGGCQPWRGFWNGGNGITPWPIKYRPSWPKHAPHYEGQPDTCTFGPSDPRCARAVEIGAAIDVSGFCGNVNVLHNGIGGSEGLRILDPLKEVSVDYPNFLTSGPDLQSLPPHLVAGEIGGGSALLDRIYFEQGELKFRGVMTPRDFKLLRELTPAVNDFFDQKVNTLYDASRSQLSESVQGASSKQIAVATPFTRPGWLTLAFQNDGCAPQVAVPTVQVWHVDCPPHRGRILPIQSTCAFNESLVLQFAGESEQEPYYAIAAGGTPESLIYHWQYLDGTESPTADNPNWKDYSSPDAAYADGRGLGEVILSGASNFSLGDYWWRVRYRGYAGCPCEGQACLPCTGSGCEGNNLPWPDGLATDNTRISKWTTPQLAQGWIKRVLQGLNPFDQRMANFHATSEGAQTYVSMIQQAGPRAEAPVAMNCTPSVINELGLIEAYETVLGRARQFSIDSGVSTDPALVALMLITGKIADLYMLLGNEALADAYDPTIGVLSDASYDPHSMFCFQNQVPSLLEEELGLLRGRDDTNPASPIVAPDYNRLFWNFSGGPGEVAYANNYMDNLEEAKALYPQGHGDAWGHYLTAIKKFYALMRHPSFQWINTTEAVLVNGVPRGVGYQYERQFAKVAAAKAEAGAAITALTARQLHGTSQVRSDGGLDPNGYPDSNVERAWGVQEWAQRSGQAAYVDWVVANALLIDEDTDPNHANDIRKIDRTTVPELRKIASHFVEIQTTMDNVNSGLNPLGLANNVVPFGLDPNAGKSHFEQIYERAIPSLQGVWTAFNYANATSRRLRSLQDEVDRFDDLVSETKLDYTSRLIEVFGRPYNEDSNYTNSNCPNRQCPDLLNYEIIDLPEMLGDSVLRTETISVDYFEQVVDPDTGAITAEPRTITYTISTDGIGFVKPSHFSNRPEPGRIQFAKSELVQALFRFAQAQDAYEAHNDEVERQVRLLESLYNLNRARLEILDEGTDRRETLDAFLRAGRASELALRRAANVGRIAARVTADTAIATSFLAAGVPPPGETVYVARNLALGIADGVAEHLEILADGSSFLQFSISLDKEMAARQEQLKIIEVEGNFQETAAFAELERLVRMSPTLRLQLYTLAEAANQARGMYMAEIGKGLRLHDEYLAFQQRTGDQVRDYRYQDMAFRIFRNDALQKYRALFDLAAQYVFLAAKAFDYETSQLRADTNSGQNFLNDIVRERILGIMDNGLIPTNGDGGLAGKLVAMKAVFDATAPDLGLNSPDVHHREFSLRWELFRISEYGSLQEWQARLEDARIADLNGLAEYVAYCKELNEPPIVNPAIVIRFGTTAQSTQLNLFGRLTTGDVTIPDRDAIKLLKYGVRFVSYPGFPLNDCVNVYLVPVGADMQRVPGEGQVREWHLLDQTLPIPKVLTDGDLAQQGWLPWDSFLDGGGSSLLLNRRRIPTVAAASYSSPACVDFSSKLLGRSLWNTEWLLIIPGSSLSAVDPEGALDALIYGPDGYGGITDIKLIMDLYGY